MSVNKHTKLWTTHLVKKPTQWCWKAKKSVGFYLRNEMNFLTSEKIKEIIAETNI